jgi:5-amino-6-(5-phosphoribosylamino)uracil reductase
MSADGKLGTVLHDHVAIGSPEDRRRMSWRRAEADAVIVGGQTFRNWPLPLVEDPAALLAPMERRRPIINLVLTRRGILGSTRRRWPDPRVQLVIVGGLELDRSAHEAAFTGAIVHQSPEPDLLGALGVLEAMGAQSILIEGGGELIFEALRVDRLDELFITVCPLILGGRAAPTPADGPGFSAEAARRLRLLHAETIDQEVYLHYAVTRTSG